MPLILDNVRKTFGGVVALDGVSLAVSQGEFLAVLGPSGSGKTTLLRIMAGLETPEGGALALDGADLSALGPRQRRVGVVFQAYALFRHMTVAQNIAFGLSVRSRRDRPPPETIRRRVGELLSLVQLEGVGDRYPAQLSGGQQQRVALARALAIEPRILLLDEPFGALDARVRRELRRWLRRLHDETGVTTILVTHDQQEALELADRVAVLNAGRLEQIGTPDEVYRSPATPFVFDFLGAANVARGEVREGHLHLLGAVLAAPAGASEGPVQVYVRPHDLALATNDGFEARVASVTELGVTTRIQCVAQGVSVEVEWPSAPGPQIAAGAVLRLSPRRMGVFPA